MDEGEGERIGAVIALFFTVRSVSHTGVLGHRQDTGLGVASGVAFGTVHSEGVL